jgi:hypothetical protein
VPSRLLALSTPRRGIEKNKCANAKLENEQGSYSIMACDCTRELFEKWKEFTNALHILQRKLRHIDKEFTERVRMSTGERK